MMQTLAAILVLLTGLFLVGLAIAALLSPARATRFLGSFASSARAHYLELLVRLVAGGAMVLYAPDMPSSGFFLLFGWMLLITSLGLCAIPWRWHQRFAQWAVPYAIPHLRLVAVASLLLGGFVLASVLLGA